MDQYTWADPPSRTAFPVAAPGYPFIYASAFATAVFALLGWPVPAVAGILVTVAIALFFRDPDRATPVREGAIIAPADGKVVFVGKVEANPYIEGPCMKVGIFMSVFNVHVNRMPCSGKIDEVRHYPGKFLPADKDSASLQNERNAVMMTTEDGRAIGVVQVAGLIARRIITWVNTDDRVAAGQRFGMICFGSRVDLYLPENTVISITKGSRVSAGFTVLGQLSEGEPK